MTRTSDRQLLLLDTHVWIWLMLESGELAIGARAAINRAAASGQLRIAAISVWKPRCWLRAAVSLWAGRCRSE